MTITYSQKHHTDKYSQQSSIIWLVLLNGWMFFYKLSGCAFESRCCLLSFRCRTCFEQGVLWHSGNYEVQIHSETRTWDDNDVYVTCSSVINIHILWKKEEIKTVSFLTRPHSSLVPWRSLTWINGWCRENIFDVDCWYGCTQK